jgi:hypothetical protein
MDSGPDVKKLSNVLQVIQVMTYLFVCEMLMTLVLCPKHGTPLDGDGFLGTIHMTKNDVLTNKPANLHTNQLYGEDSFVVS